MMHSTGVRTVKTKFKEAVLIEPVVHEDYRGYFKETYKKNVYQELGIQTDFVQDNISLSYKNVLRGMHYDFNVAKLVQVVKGRTYHVIADMREDSPTFKQWQSFILSDSNHRQLFVPAGFANGFLVLSDIALVQYKQGTYWSAETDQGFLWNDPLVGIRWPIKDPILSEKDGMKFT